MSTASTLLRDLGAKGVRLWLDDARLRYAAPAGALTPELRASVQAVQPELVQLLQEKQHGVDQRVSLGRHPLSGLQQSLYAAARLQRESTVYNMPACFELLGTVDADRLQRAADQVVAAHPILRTRFELDEDGPVQILAPTGGACFEVCEVEGVPEEFMARLVRPFDLAAGENLRVTLGRARDTGRTYLIVDLPHVCADESSVSRVVEDLLRAYGGEPVPVPGREYPAFALEEHRYLTGGDSAAAREYWRRCFAVPPPAVELPYDHRRPVVPTYRGGCVDVPGDVDPAEVARTCAALGITPFVFFATCHAILLGKYGAERDVIMGTPCSIRQGAADENVVGPFVNVLPLRVALPRHEAFATTAARVRTVLAEALQHRRIPTREIIEVAGGGDAAGTEFLQNLFALQKRSAVEQGRGELKLRHVRTTHRIAKFDVSLVLGEIDDRYVLAVEFSSDRFEPSTAQRLGASFWAVVRAALRCPSEPVGAIVAGGAPEQQRIIEEYGRGPTSGDDRSIVACFLEQAKLRPGAVALRQDGRERTYEELNRAADGVAARLRAAGQSAGAPVMLLTTRSLSAIEGTLGILKAGAACLPMDPTWPAERIMTILAESRCRCVLLGSGATPPPGFDGAVLTVDDAASASVPEPVVGEPPASDLAYVLFTSGSTGTPKGVMLGHRGIIRLVKDNTRLRFGPDCVHLQFAPLTFDASLFEIWAPLLNGGKLVLAPEGAVPLSELGRVIRTERINAVVLVTGLFHAMVDECVEDLAGLDEVLVGGDVISARHVDRLYARHPHVRVVNGYGPTECSVFATTHHVAPCDIAAGSIPIGRPINNTRVFLLDHDDAIAPIGGVGELCVAGAGVAQGYLNRPELTEERFVQVAACGPERVFRTGDMARWLPDGRIQFLGRRDGQVKIRGNRVEVDEVRLKLCRHPKVRAAVVIAAPGAKGMDKQLGAYVCADQATEAELLAFMQRVVPSYMVPTWYVFLERLPLPANGKVDLRALPPPTPGGAWEPPAPGLETTLAGMWREVLGVERVGAVDSLFRLGGHSLSALRLLARIKREFGVDVPLREFFEDPTVRALARRCAESHRPAPPLIPRREGGGPQPASPAQRRIYALQQLDPESLLYNVPFVARVTGPFDAARFEQALRALVARHESLRTAFVAGTDGLCQRVEPEVDFKLEVATDETATVAELTRAFLRPFDLSLAPLLRARLVRRAGGETLLLADFHHSIADGASMETILRELGALYEGRTLPTPALQYRDFCAWQATNLAGEAMAQSRAYWQRQFENGVPVLELPTDRPRPAVRDLTGATLRYRLDAALTRELEEFCRAQSVTLYAALLGAFTVVLSRYSGQHDIVVGSPVAGRNHPDLEGTVGMFVNTVALRSEPRPDRTGVEYVRDVQARVAGALEHQDFPFEDLIDLLEVRRDMARSPLFDVMLVLNRGARERCPLGAATLEPLMTDVGMAKFDLTWRLTQVDDALECELEYGTALFERTTIERLATHLEVVLNALVRTPDAPLADIDLISDAERRRLLQDFAGPCVPYPRDVCLHELFERQVDRTPDALAIVQGNNRLTFAEVNARANRLAHRLRADGTRPDNLVALLLERAPEMVIAILAILKAGGAYVPIDPNDPPDRIGGILRDSGARIVLTQSSYADALSGFDGRVHVLDRGEFAGEDANPSGAAHSGQLAYVIYTSGSTGRPKGAMLEHRGVVNRLLWMAAQYEVGPGDVILQKTTYTFDVSVWELLLGPITGATTALLEPGGEKDPVAIVRALQTHGVTLAHFVPSMLGAFLSTLAPGTHFPTWRHCICSGEALRLDHKDLFHERIAGSVCLQNLYGPTEASIDVSHLHVTPDVRRITIGRPVANTALYVLDPARRLVPIGVPGELCISGIQVARGYLGRPELTAERFVPDPFCEGMTLYRTGDLARWLPDGTIEYLGRQDGQVKIRGHRVELGEIESALCAIPGVTEAAVTLVGRDEDRDLCAHVVAPGKEATDLREVLLRTLPAYMVPTHFVAMPRLPLTSSGKVDRKNLPPPVARSAVSYVAPRDNDEKEVARLFADALGVPRVGIEDNFFALGGHSLKAVRLVSAVEARYGVKIGVRAAFNHPTVEMLVRVIRAAQPTARRRSVIRRVEDRT